ncbi:hypothetical protein TFUB22_00823 [Tannerella forsythia]|nr:hypothetical protein TFUB22_00823 [Tannerella forsythia]
MFFIRALPRNQKRLNEKQTRLCRNHPSECFKKLKHVSKTDVIIQKSGDYTP